MPFWLATAVISLVTMVGCGVGHAIEIIVHNNWSTYNTGPGIWIQTLFLPVALIVLVAVYRKQVSFTLQPNGQWPGLPLTIQLTLSIA